MIPPPTSFGEDGPEFDHLKQFKTESSAREKGPMKGGGGRDRRWEKKEGKGRADLALTTNHC